MRFTRTSISTATLVALIATLTPAAHAGTPQVGTTNGWKGALSAPVTDSYYSAYSDAHIDTLHYGLNLDWQPRTKVLSGTATISLRAAANVSSFRLGLGTPLKVSRATVDGKPVKVTRGVNTVTFSGVKMAKKSRHTLVVTYAGRPASIPSPTTRGDQTSGLGFHFDSAGTTWTAQEPYGAFTWYPVNETPSDKAYYDATLTSHDGQDAAFNGRVVKDVVKGTNRTTSFHLDGPAASYLTTVAWGHFTHEVHYFNGIQLNYWYDKKAKNVNTFLPVVRQTPQMLSWLESKLGPYPFGSAGALIVDNGTAIETEDLVTFGTGAVGTAQEMMVNLTHEYSHQWFGDEVTPRDWRDLWLSESLATYMQTLYQDHIGLMKYHDAIEYYTAADSQVRKQFGPPGNYDRKQFAADSVYLSGALMLDKMHTAYGARFDAALRAYPVYYRYGNVTRDDFISFFSKRLGVNLRPFVTTWLMSKTTPTMNPPKA